MNKKHYKTRLMGIIAFAIFGVSTLIMPLLINNNTNQLTNNSEKSTQLNSTSLNKNGQIVNSVEDIIIDKYAIATGGSSYAIVKNNGPQELYVWGQNDFGQLGLGDNLNRFLPTLLPSEKLGHYTSITNIRIDKIGYIEVQTPTGAKAYVWGLNGNGQLGLGDKVNRLSPALFDTSRFGNFASIENIGFLSSESMSDSSHIILKTSDGKNKIYVWGDNKYGQLGVGSSEKIFTSPIELNLSTFGSYNKIIEFSTNEQSYVWLDAGTTDKIFVWGSNEFGQLGTGDGLNKNTPINFLPNILINKKIRLFSLNWSGCMILENTPINDSVYVWGYNSLGQLGMGNFDDFYLSPTLFDLSRFNGLTEVIDFYTDFSSYMIFMINGVVKHYVCGTNFYGELGVNTDVRVSTPLLFDVTKLTDYVRVLDSSFTHRKFSQANYIYIQTLSGNRLYAWGKNTNGNLGIGSNNYKNATPKRVSYITFDETEIIDCEFSEESSYLTFKKNDEIFRYATGLNTKGQFGLNNANNQSRFIPVASSKTIPTNPRSISTSSKLTATDAFDSLNSRIFVDKLKLSEYADISSFPADSKISIDPSTVVDYENGIINLAIKTNKHNLILVPDTQIEEKVFNVKIEGFVPAKDTSTHPVSANQKLVSELNFIDKTLGKLIDDEGGIISDSNLRQYLEMSCIPRDAIVNIRWSIDSQRKQLTLNIKSNTHFDDSGRFQHSEYNQVLVIDIPQIDMILIISLVSAGLMIVFLAIVLINSILTRRKIRYK